MSVVGALSCDPDHHHHWCHHCLRRTHPYYVANGHMVLWIVFSSHPEWSNSKTSLEPQKQKSACGRIKNQVLIIQRFGGKKKSKSWPIAKWWVMYLVIPWQPLSLDHLDMVHLWSVLLWLNQTEICQSYKQKKHAFGFLQRSLLYAWRSIEMVCCIVPFPVWVLVNLKTNR